MRKAILASCLALTPAPLGALAQACKEKSALPQRPKQQGQQAMSEAQFVHLI